MCQFFVYVGGVSKVPRSSLFILNRTIYIFSIINRKNIKLQVQIKQLFIRRIKKLFQVCELRDSLCIVTKRLIKLFNYNFLIAFNSVFSFFFF